MNVDEVEEPSLGRWQVIETFEMACMHACRGIRMHRDRTYARFINAASGHHEVTNHALSPITRIIRKYHTS